MLPTWKVKLTKPWFSYFLLAMKHAFTCIYMLFGYNALDTWPEFLIPPLIGFTLLEIGDGGLYAWSWVAESGTGLLMPCTHWPWTSDSACSAGACNWDLWCFFGGMNWARARPGNSLTARMITHYHVAQYLFLTVRWNRFKAWSGRAQWGIDVGRITKEFKLAAKCMNKRLLLTVYIPITPY